MATGRSYAIRLLTEEPSTTIENASLPPRDQRLDLVAFVCLALRAARVVPAIDIAKAMYGETNFNYKPGLQTAIHRLRGLKLPIAKREYKLEVSPNDVDILDFTARSRVFQDKVAQLGKVAPTQSEIDALVEEGWALHRLWEEDPRGYFAGFTWIEGELNRKFIPLHRLFGKAFVSLLLAADLRAEAGTVINVFEAWYLEGQGTFDSPKWEIPSVEPSRSAAGVFEPPPGAGVQRNGHARQLTADLEPRFVSLVVGALVRQGEPYPDVCRRLQVSPTDLAMSLAGQVTLLDSDEGLFRLPYVACEAELFPNVARARAFLAALPPGQSNEMALTERSELAEAGSALDELVEVERTCLRFVGAWRDFVDPLSDDLSADHRIAKQGALLKLYDAAAEMIPAGYLPMFARSDFANFALWRLHLRPGAVDPSVRSHVEFSNECIAARFVANLREKSKPDVVRVVDAGNGLCSLLYHLCAQLARTFPDRPPRIEYWGCDVNASSTIQANELAWGRPTDGPYRISREILSTIQNYKGGVTPVRDTFVVAEDMVDAMPPMARDTLVRGTVDLVCFSYSLHHVADNRKAREEIEKLASTAAGADEMRRIVAMAQRAIELGEPGHPRQERLGEYQGVFSSEQLEVVILTADKPRHRRRAAPELAALVLDQKLTVLDAAYHLLRPGGLVAIADPDGLSQFNAATVQTNAEMAVAAFLTSDECKARCRSIGFDVEERGSHRVFRHVTGFSRRAQNHTTDLGLSSLESELPSAAHEYYSDAERKHDIADDNLGYIVYGARPMERP